MKHTRILAYFAAMTILVPSAGAATGDDAQLARILMEISTHHPRIRSRALDAAARKDLAQYAAWKYPDPRAGLAWSNLPYKKDLRIIRDRTPMTGIEFSLRQPVPFPGRLSAQADVADVEARQALLQLAVEKNNLAYEFLKEASDALVLERLLRLNRDYAQRFQLVSNVARTRYSVGRGTLADVSQAELNFSSFEQRSAEFEGRRRAKLEMLAYYLIPVAAKEAIRPEETPEPVQEHVSAEVARAERLLRALENADGLEPHRLAVLDEIGRINLDDDASVAATSLDVAMTDLELQAIRERRKLARMEYLPDFEVFASYREREKVSGDPAYGEDFYSFGFTMSVPLWSALSAGSAVDAQEKRDRSTQISRSEVIQRVRYRLRSIEADRRSLAERIELYQASLIPQAARARDSARLAYETGRIDFFALLESWNTLFMQEAEAIRLRGERERLVFEEARLLNVLVPAYVDESQTEYQP